MTIEKHLSAVETMAAEDYLSKLSLEDQNVVRRVVEALEHLAAKYDKDALPSERMQSALFGAYAIGGWVNKEGSRPDIDLLVVTNAQWHRLGYTDPPRGWEHEFVYAAEDGFIELVTGHFRATGFEVEIPDRDDIPDEYSEGVEPRMMLRLKPLEHSGSPIDIVYISAGYNSRSIASFEDFYEQESRAFGALAGRVALLETVVTIQPLKYRL